VLPRSMRSRVCRRSDRLRWRPVRWAGAALDALGDLACEALGLPDDPTCDRHQSAVALPHALSSLLGAASGGAPDLQQALPGAARANAQLGASGTRELVIRFIVRVSTRTPSPSNDASVG